MGMLRQLLPRSTVAPAEEPEENAENAESNHPIDNSCREILPRKTGRGNIPQESDIERHRNNACTEYADANYLDCCQPPRAIYDVSPEACFVGGGIRENEIALPSLNVMQPLVS